MRRAARTAVSEVIGPAGAGKSTLAELINRSESGARAGFSVWRLPRRKLSSTALRLLPELLRLKVSIRDFGAPEMKQLIRLETLYRALAAAEADGARRLFMDESIVFALAQMIVERGALPFWLDDPRLGLKARWGRILRSVIWLDAPNEILIRRIRERAKTHRMKFQSDAAVGQFLDAYRAAFRTVLEALQPSGGFRTLYFDTERVSPEEIARLVLTDNFPANDFRRQHINKEFEFYVRS